MAQYLYNGVLLPEIPADVLAEYPYCWIRKNEKTGYYQLIFSALPPYFYQDAIAYGNDTSNPTAECVSYRISISNAETSTSWEYVSTDNTWHGLAYNITVVWSNHDITKGPATATSEIYFYGSEPVDPNAPVEPEEPEEVYYTISGTRLTGIADQVRRISGVTDELTPEQMETNLTNLEIPEELPDAEEAAFGVATANEEYGITINDTSKIYSSAWANQSITVKYTAKEAFTLTGIRAYLTSNKYGMNIKVSVNDEEKTTVNIGYGEEAKNDWTYRYFNTPLNIAVGDVITLYKSSEDYPRYVSFSDTTINGKIEVTYSNSANPTAVFGVFDIIINPGNAPLPDSYEIQRSTMDNIAEEAQRISGATTKLNTTQIINALEDVKLQEKTATPSEEVQNIVPDEGYYGLSSVTVEAVEPINLDEEIVAQDDLIAQIQAMLEGKAAGGIPENARLYYVGNAVSETALRIESENIAISVLA